MKEAQEKRAKGPKIAVVGSLHMDLIVKAKEIPRIGETVMGESFRMAPGGKGANQAVAATKLGADVTMVGRVGSDLFGENLIENAKKHGINTEFITCDSEAHTGLALIVVDKNGNNIITVAPGADLRVCQEDVKRAFAKIKNCDVLLTQLEIPLPVVEYAVDEIFGSGMKVVLNPSPGNELTEEMLRKITIITPNEREAEILTDIKITNLSSAKIAAEKILKKGVENVVLTLGKKGAIVATKEEITAVEGFKVNPVDTTGAGDAFCSALAVAISSGKNLKDAAVYANCAGALATTKIGAQEALPTKEELEQFMRKRGLI